MDDSGLFDGSAEVRLRRAHIAALRRAYGDGEILQTWIEQAEAGTLRTGKGQLGRWRASLATLREDRRRRMGTIYLIHFEQPIGDQSNARGQAQHYLGFSQNLGARLEAHRNGTGAAIMRAVVEAGIDWSVVRTWSGTRDDERALKDRHQHSHYCPACQGANAQVGGAMAVAG